MVLTGFSRGAIACGYIGLRNDRVARLWRGTLAATHFDGVRTKWPYADCDRVSAGTRLLRLNGRPVFVAHEGSAAETKDYVMASGAGASFTFETLPYRNHTDSWVLRDAPAREQARDWIRCVVSI